MSPQIHTHIIRRHGVMIDELVGEKCEMAKKTGGRRRCQGRERGENIERGREKKN